MLVNHSFLTSIANFGEIGIASIIGSLVILLGYSRFFLYSAWIVGAGLLILYFIRTKRKRKNKLI
jgi:hypothetical protein